MEQILAQLKDKPPPLEAAMYEGPKAKLLVAICAELQRQAGESEFFLDCRTAARLIECDRMTAWRYLNMLHVEGLLSKGKVGHTGRATCWRYIIKEV